MVPYSARLRRILYSRIFTCHLGCGGGTLSTYRIILDPIPRRQRKMPRYQRFVPKFDGAKSGRRSPCLGRPDP